METDAPSPRTRISRGPVIVLIAGGALAFALVMFGASLAAVPAPTLPPEVRPGTAAVPRRVTVIMRDYRFDPTPIPLFRGETVELHVFNGGLVEHELVLGDESVQSAWAAADAAATPSRPFATAPPASVGPSVGGLRFVLASGASTVVRYDVPAREGLQMICHLPGHAERGMVGEVSLLEQSGDSR